MNRWGEKKVVAAEPKGKLADDTPWSERDLASLREMRADDMSARLIAGRLNRTVKAVEGQIAALRAARR